MKISHRLKGINRIRLEFKDVLASAFQLPYAGINRIRLEFKGSDNNTRILWS